MVRESRTAATRPPAPPRPRSLRRTSRRETFSCERRASCVVFADQAMRPRDDELTGTQKHTFLNPGRPHVVAMWPGGTLAKELPDTGRITVGRSRTCDIT